MNRRTAAWLASAGLSVVGLSGCSYAHQAKAAGEERLSFPADQTTALHVKTGNGFVRAAAGAGNVFEITVRKEGRAPTTREAQEALAAIEVVSETTDGVRTLTWRYKEPRSKAWNATVSFEVLMPASVALAATTHNGALNVSGLASDVELSTHNGAVVVEGHTGARLKAESYNGRLTVSSTAADLDAETYNGAIRCTASNGAAPRVRLVSHNGGIDLDLADDASAALTCTTSNGSVRCDLPVTADAASRTSLRGKLGDGKGRVQTETHNGSIRVR
ncbi:MAG: hypothetical protein FLDDKLPJ_02301 [Phycisphaerae bacterium]|nr:hypothetical protein [Phycisphaerae bacterium]